MSDRLLGKQEHRQQETPSFEPMLIETLANESEHVRCWVDRCYFAGPTLERRNDGISILSF